MKFEDKLLEVANEIEHLTTDLRFSKYLGLKEERDTLAYENKAMAETLEELGYDVDSLIFKHKEGE